MNDSKQHKEFLSPRDEWDRLSLQEQAEMIKIAVNNNIFNLADIRNQYNEFAEDINNSIPKSIGNMYKDGGDTTNNDMPIIYNVDDKRPIYVNTNTGDVWQKGMPKGGVMIPEINVTPPHYYSSYKKDAIKPILDFMPIIGDALQVIDAKKAFEDKDYLTAGMLTGSLLLPNIVEKPLKWAGKRILKYKKALTSIDLDKNVHELPVRTMRGGVKDSYGNLMSDEELVNNWKRSQDFYKMRLRNKGIKQQGHTYIKNRDDAFKIATLYEPGGTKKEFYEILDELGGGYAAPDGNQGYGIVTKELNTKYKQRRGTTNSAKVHEDSHLMHDNFMIEKMENINWSNLNMDKDEAAARGTQIKSILGIKDNAPITSEQLKYMKDNFVRLTGMDNMMQVFLNSITDYDSAAKWLSENAYSLGGALQLGIIKHPSGKKGL